MKFKKYQLGNENNFETGYRTQAKIIFIDFSLLLSACFNLSFKLNTHFEQLYKWGSFILKESSSLGLQDRVVGHIYLMVGQIKWVFRQEND